MRITSAGYSSPVYVDGLELDLNESLAVFNHSPTGFSWGYGGSGPAQLALAILLNAGLDADEAVRLHQQFKWDHVATWRPEGGNTDEPLDVDVDVHGWLDAHERTEA